MLGEDNLTKVDRTTLLRKHYAFQLGCFVSQQESTVGGLFAYSDITPIPMWNHSAWIDPSGDLQRFLNDSREWHGAKGRRPVVYIPSPTEAQLGLLQANGFEKFDEEAWMVCDTTSATHSKTENVVEVQDQKLLNQFVETFSASFQIKESGYRRALV